MCGLLSHHPSFAYTCSIYGTVDTPPTPHQCRSRVLPRPHTDTWWLQEAAKSSHHNSLSCFFVPGAATVSSFLKHRLAVCFSQHCYIQKAKTTMSVLLYSVTRLLDLKSRYSDDCRKKVQLSKETTTSDNLRQSVY